MQGIAQGVGNGVGGAGGEDCAFLGRRRGGSDTNASMPVSARFPEDLEEVAGVGRLTAKARRCG